MPDLQADDALGLIETRGLIAAVEAADAMVKASDVRLLRIEQTVGALMTVQVTGEVAAVRAAVDAGRYAAGRVGGEVLSAHVIPRPAEGLGSILGGEGLEPHDEISAEETDAPPEDAPTSEDVPDDLEEMTVNDLRQLAREQEDFPLQGREISRAKKEELVQALRTQGG